MLVTQKCQYALRAVFELARRDPQEVVKIAEIAKQQAIPPRFLEVILNQLKQGGFVESLRGHDGGYRLIRDPRGLSVGEIIRYVQGPFDPVGCVSGDPKQKCSLHGNCVFLPMWQRVEHAMAGIYDGTTFAGLVEEDRRMSEQFVPSYTI